MTHTCLALFVLQPATRTAVEIFVFTNPKTHPSVLYKNGAVVTYFLGRQLGHKVLPPAGVLSEQRTHTGKLPCVREEAILGSSSQ
jgi:hypothetical protein